MWRLINIDLYLGETSACLFEFELVFKYVRLIEIILLLMRVIYI